MGDFGLWGHLGGLLLVAAALGGHARTIRIALIAAALVVLGGALSSGLREPAYWAALVAIAAAVRLSGVSLPGRARFTEDEQAMRDALPGLGKAEARHLIDQGVWLDAKPGDILTREGEPVGHLYYLASGKVRVTSGGTAVGEAQAGGFIGEVTVLTGAPATGTVTVDTPSRLWCAPAPALRAYVDNHDDVRRALEAAFRQALSDKLVASNKRLSMSSAG